MLLTAQFSFAQDGVGVSTFGTNGVVVKSGSDVVFYPHLMNDEKIVYQKQGVIQCLTGNGQEDSSFGAEGQITLNQQGTSGYYNLLFKDDKILAFTSRTVSSNWTYYGGRYNLDGTLDTSFGTNGTITMDMGSTAGTIFANFLNNNLVITGSTQSNGGSYNNITGRVINMTTGNASNIAGGGAQLYSGYNVGTSSNGTSTVDYIGKSVVMPNGTLFVSYTAEYYRNTGLDYEESGLIRIVPTQNYIFTYHNDFDAHHGYVKNDVFVKGSNVYTLTGGWVDTANQAYPTCFVQKRYSTGDPVSDFGTRGKLSLELTHNGNRVSFTHLAVQPDDKILVAGSTTHPTNSWYNEDLVLARFLPTGAIDTTFGTNGYITYRIPTTAEIDVNNRVKGLFVSATGDTVYLMGSNDQNSVLLKYFNSSLAPATVPVFAAVAPICAGSTLEALPTTSENGVTGTWFPALNNEATTIYTFTPDAGQNASETTLEITVYEKPATPTGAVEQIFNEGALLADVVVEPMNVTWYPTLADAEARTNWLNEGTVLENGHEYFAVLYNANECASDVFVVTTWVSLSTTDVAMGSLKMYPNPAAAQVTIRLEDTINAVTVYTMLGQKVLAQTPVANEVTVDLAQLGSGTYFVKVVSGSNESTLKLMKK